MNILYRKPWIDVCSKVKDLNFPLFEVMDKIANPSEGMYIYEIELPYGVDLIVKGKQFLFDETFLKKYNCREREDQSFSYSEFLNDFSNKNDHPLGLIEDGIIEIHELNECQLPETGKLKYYFPLHILKKGELLGTYGATDIICGSHVDKPHYTYSASTGNYCVYPLLPKSIKTASKPFRIKAKLLFKEFNVPFEEEMHICSYFPGLLRKLYSTTDFKTKLLLIPDAWFTGEPLGLKLELRALISKISWIQSKEARLNDLTVIPILERIGGKASSYVRNRIMAEMIAYLLGIIEGRRLIMKKVDYNSHLHEPYLILKEAFENIYDPVLFNFDFLKSGEWGVFPLFTFPTLSPIDPFYSFNKFLEEFKFNLEDVPHSSHVLDRLKYYSEPTEFAEEHFPNQKIYTQLFLTRAVLKVHMSN